MVTGSIYCLKDAQKVVRYIGLTTMTLDERLWFHLNEAEKSKSHTYKLAWLRKMKNNGTKPTIHLIEEIHDDPNKIKLAERESYWIDFFRALLSDKLTNATNGGEGIYNQVWTPEARKKVGELTKARLSNPEDRKKLSEAKKKVCSDPEWRKKQSERFKLWHAERRAKGLISRSNKGKPGKTHTEEWKAKQSERTKKMWEDGILKVPVIVRDNITGRIVRTLRH